MKGSGQIDADRDRTVTDRCEAHLADKPLRQIHHPHALKRLRGIQESGAFGALFPASLAVSRAAAELPLGEGAESFFSDS